MVSTSDQGAVRGSDLPQLATKEVEPVEVRDGFVGVHEWNLHEAIVKRLVCLRLAHDGFVDRTIWLKQSVEVLVLAEVGQVADEKSFQLHLVSGVRGQNRLKLLMITCVIVFVVRHGYLLLRV